MTIKSYSAGSDRRHAATSTGVMALRAQSFLPALARLGAKSLAKSKSALRALQMARMLSILSSMSDHQLAEIGISRSDIPDYAATLMADG